MTRTDLWFTSAAVVGLIASLGAAALLWLLVTRPVAVAQAMALGQ